MTKKNAFIYKTNAHLPETEIYKKFLKDLNFNVEIKKNNSKYKNLEPKIAWFIAGLQKYNLKAQKIIVDYRSRSLGKFYIIKDFIKLILNKSDINIFAHKDLMFFFSKYIQKRKTFYLPMGSFCKFKKIKKKYDFIYIGEISLLKTGKSFIELINTLSKQYKIIVIGNIERSIYLTLKKFNNLKIINRNIEIKKLNTFINQSKIGISWYTNNSSIKNQISTKILDYNICNLPILCNNSSVNFYTFKKYKIKKYILYKKDKNISFDFRNVFSTKNKSFQEIFDKSSLKYYLCKIL